MMYHPMCVYVYVVGYNCPPPWRSHWRRGGGGGLIEMLGICPSVHASVYDSFRFHELIYTIFDPVMHTTITLDEFEDEWPKPLEEGGGGS